MSELEFKLAEAQQKMDHAIHMTPTGPVREAITEANLYIMMCQDLAKNYTEAKK